MRRFVSLALILLSLLVLAMLSWIDFESFGKLPDGELLGRLKASPQWHAKQDQFVNRRADLVPQMRANMDLYDMTKRWLLNPKQGSPEHPLPQVIPKLDAFARHQEGVHYIWLGHSSFLVNIRGTIVLFDPVFTWASPIHYLVPRFQDPVVALEMLPKIDLIVISHDHYDHLDSRTVAFFRNKKTKFVVPLGVSSHLKYWSIQDERIIELDWWEQRIASGLEITCTPSQHFSGRLGTGNNRTLWASWVIKDGAKASLFYSGDTGYDTHFAEIGQRLGPFDIAFIENGQYNELWRAVHMLPHEGIRAFSDLGARIFVPVHWGMFDLSIHNWFDPPEEILKLARENKVPINIPKIGQEISLADPKQPVETWWR